MNTKRMVPVPVTPELAALMQKRRELLDPTGRTEAREDPLWLDRLDSINHLIALHFEVAMTLAYDRKGWTL